jgi:hypothetical protein
MVTIQERTFRQFGGLVKLTPKGMSRSRNP